MVLLWRMLSVNMTQYLSTMSPTFAADWPIYNTERVLAQAANLAASNPERAYVMVSHVAQNHPLNAQAWVMLGLLMEGKGQAKQSQQLMRWVATMFPNRPDTQLQLGNFWARQSNVLYAMHAWGRAIDMQPALRKALYPQILTLVEKPTNFVAARQAFAEPSAWADGFFRYAVNNAAYMETLKLIYYARLKTKTPLTDEIRRDYLGRLLRESMWTDAYFVWLNGLSASKQLALGHIYDGGFEQEVHVEGFSWRLVEVEGLTVRPQQIQGASGQYALHIEFKGAKRQPSLLASQILLLDAGPYLFSGRVKLESLSAVNGLRWELVCLTAASTVLATSQNFIDKMHWQSFNLPLEIPADCPAQMLRLLLDPVDAKRTNLSGSLWFDDLKISNQ
jgi:hypothetical protein